MKPWRRRRRRRPLEFEFQIGNVIKASRPLHFDTKVGDFDHVCSFEAVRAHTYNNNNNAAASTTIVRKSFGRFFSASTR